MELSIIQVTPSLELSVHKYPEGSYSEQNEAIRSLIGNGCSYYEHVMPKRLYTYMKMPNSPTVKLGGCVSILIDEEGALKHNREENPLGSYLYETDIHGCPIYGTILFVGERYSGDGIDFCGMEDGQLEELKGKLEAFAEIWNHHARRD